MSRFATAIKCGLFAVFCFAAACSSDAVVGDNGENQNLTTNACAQAGGKCKGLNPTVCSHWGPQSCGGGLGVGCCLDDNGGGGTIDSGTNPPPPDSAVPPTCATIGGTCKGLSPNGCNEWADATLYTCGGGLGVGCCLDSQSPQDAGPQPGTDSGAKVWCTSAGGTCKGITPNGCTNWGDSNQYLCPFGLGIGCCLD